MKALAIPRNLRFGLACVALAAIAVFGCTIYSADRSPAYAADKGGAKSATDIPYLPPIARSWSGCGIGGFVGHAEASLDSPSPVTIASAGQTTVIEGFCDIQYSALVVGGFANYGWVWNDLNTIGVDNTMDVGARIGVLATQSALPYVHAGWTRATGSGIPDVDGLKFGAGLEVRVSNSPISLDLRASRAIYDNVGGSGMDVNATEIRLGFKAKFSVGGR